MAINTDLNYKLADQVFSIYSHAETVMLEKVAKRIERGITDEGWNELKAGEITDLRNEFKEIINDLEKMSNAKVTESINDSYKSGVMSVNKDFGLPDTILKEMGIYPASQRLILEANNLFSNVNFRVLRNSEDSYRRIQAEVSMGVLTGVETRKQVGQRMLNKLADEGITGFVDKAGRRWDMASYCEMATRTVTSKAALAGHLDRQIELGKDLIMITSHGGCPTCRPWEGKVLSISGNDPNYSSLVAATEAGLFHPNCKHTLVAYNPDIDVPYEYPEPNTPEQYEYTQRQRYNERMIRKWKKRESVAITPEAQILSQSKIKEYQSAQRVLLKEYEEKFGNKMKRRYDRESIKNRIGVKNVDDSPNWIKKSTPITQINNMEYLTDKYGVKFSEDADANLDKRVYKSIDETIQRINSKLPEKYQFSNLVDTVNFTTSYSEASNTHGAAVDRQMKMNARKLNTTEYGFKDRFESLQSKYESEINMGNAKNMNVLSTFTHETGHLLHDQMIRNIYGKDPLFEGKKTLEKLVKDIRKETLEKVDLTAQNKDKFKIASGLSEYATTSPHEFFAEAFMEYIDNPKPRPISKAFWEVLMNRIGR